MYNIRPKRTFGIQLSPFLSVGLFRIFGIRYWVLKMSDICSVFTARCYAERGIATASRRPPSVRDVGLKYRDHMNFMVSLISLRFSLIIGTKIDNLWWLWIAISSNFRKISRDFADLRDNSTDKQIKIDQYCQRQRRKLLNVLFNIMFLALICHRFLRLKPSYTPCFRGRAIP